MKSVLYLTNIEVPYRVRFFNELAKYCDLTVLYESHGSEERNTQWAKSEQIRYRVHYLSSGKKLTGILRAIFSGYDAVIIGCCNSRLQIVAYTAMRLVGKPYLMNLDGETFLEGTNWKTQLKRLMLRGASVYLAAGEKSAQSLKRISGGSPVIPYWFSSLTEAAVESNGASKTERGETVLVVGQYFDYKGMDIALKAASMDLSIPYQFLGMGSRTELFLKDHRGQIPPNVEIVPFLQKKELEALYASCAMLVLPSRQECWGLVINEAASFGLPIISTWGSGAAVEFLADAYPEYLAKPADAHSLLECIHLLRNSQNKLEYGDYLLSKSKAYTIEKSVEAHLNALKIGE